MKQYLLLIRTEGDYCEGMKPEEHKAHLQKVGEYIQKLTQQGNLIAAQPLSMTGSMLHGRQGIFKDGPFNESKEVIIGYYHIMAKDLSDATEIAKANPVFAATDARMEIREIKQEEGIN